VIETNELVPPALSCTPPPQPPRRPCRRAREEATHRFSPEDPAEAVWRNALASANAASSAMVVGGSVSLAITRRSQTFARGGSVSSLSVASPTRLCTSACRVVVVERQQPATMKHDAHDALHKTAIKYNQLGTPLISAVVRSKQALCCRFTSSTTRQPTRKVTTNHLTLSLSPNECGTRNT